MDDQQRQMQLKVIEQEVREVSEQLEIFERQQKELHNTVNALEQLPNIGEEEALLPLASGIYVKGKITDTEKILVTMGADVTVGKTIPETVEIVKEQLNQLAHFEKKLTDRLTQLSDLADKVNSELQNDV